AVFLSDRTRHYGPAQVRLGEELASRFALALRASQLYNACKLVLDGHQETLATTIHDLVSPLTYIKGTAQRLRCIEQSIGTTPATTEFARRLEAIDAAVNRMGSTLSALVRMTQPHSDGTTRAIRRRTDLVALVRSVAAVEQLLDRGHSIRLCEMPPSLEGEWDADQLERMLVNLIGNAVKYSPMGSSVDLSVGNEVDREGAWAVVRVADQGIGIPA